MTLAVERALWSDSGWRNILRRVPVNCALYYPCLPEGFDKATAKDYSGKGNHGTITGAVFERLPSGVPYFDFNKDAAADDDILVTDAATIQNIWDGGGVFSVMVNLRSDGEGDNGYLFHKTVNRIWVSAEAASKVKITFSQNFATTNGIWITTATAITLNVWELVTIQYNADDVGNNPTIWIGTATPDLTESSTPVGTRTTDAGQNLYIGNASDGTRCTDGQIAAPLVLTTTTWTQADHLARRSRIKRLFQD